MKKLFLRIVGAVVFGAMVLAVYPLAGAAAFYVGGPMMFGAWVCLYMATR